MTENKALFFARLESKYGGNPLRYFEHVRRTAIIAMDEGHVYDPDIICTCLLHDALEDTEDIDSGIIEQFFGKEVVRRVTLLTKIPKEGYFERLKYADPMTKFVKLCDRLDNLRSIGDNRDFVVKTYFDTKKLLREADMYNATLPFCVKDTLASVEGMAGLLYNKWKIEQLI